MNKKHKEYFELLPEPYRSQAIKNYDPVYYKVSLNFYNNRDYDNKIAQSLLTGFMWDTSPEGSTYWDAFFFSINNKTAYIKLKREHILSLL